MSQIYVINGTDEGTISEEALKLFNKLKPVDADDFSQEIIEGSAANADEAHSACSETIQSLQTLPLFGNGKTVWLKNVTFLGSDRTSMAEATKAGAENLLECLRAGLPDGVNFILSASAMNKSRSLCKYLATEAKVKTYDKLDTSREGWQVECAKLVRNRAKVFNLTFDDEALELFVMLAGEETRQIASELDKIDIALGDRREVNVQDIRLLVPQSRAGLIFEVGTALARKNAGRAFELIDLQLERKESAIAILRASIIPTVRNLFMSAAASNSRKIPNENYNEYAAALNSLPQNERLWLPQKKTGGVNVYPLFLASKNAKNFSLEKLRVSMRACLEADKSLVTTGLDHRTVLHRLIATICAP